MTEAQMPEKIGVMREWVEGAQGGHHYSLTFDLDFGVHYIRADIVAELRKERDAANQGMIRLSKLDDDNNEEIESLKASLATARREAIEEVLEATKFYSCTCFKTIEELLAKDAP